MKHILVILLLVAWCGLGLADSPRLLPWRRAIEQRIKEMEGGGKQPVAPVQQNPIQPLPVGVQPTQTLPIGQTPVQPLPIGQTPTQALPIGQAPVQGLPIHQVPIQVLPIAPAPMQQLQPTGQATQPLAPSGPGQASGPQNTPTGQVPPKPAPAVMPKADDQPKQAITPNFGSYRWKAIYRGPIDQRRRS